MNKTIIIAILLFVATTQISFGQHNKKKSNKGKSKPDPTWFYASVGGGYGNSMMLNNHVSGGDLKMFYVNPHYGFDGNIGVNFSFGIGAQIGYGINSFSEEFEYKGVKQDNVISTKNLLILLRTVSQNGAYAEFGPEFNSINSSPVGVYNQYKDKHTGLILGFGTNLFWNDQFDLSAGLRLAFLFNIMEDDNYPFGNLMGSDVASLSPYEKTTVFNAMFRVTLSWHIGYFSTAQCDKHTEFLFF